MFRSDSILLPDPDGQEVLHDREYRVRAFRLSDDRLLVRGAVRDQKPPGLYLPGDPEPLTMHHMQVDLTVAFPSLEIVAADVVFEAHPHTTCPAIIGSYQGLVGLSIARGFTHKVRELFGGPRGCTHTTALLLAMGPVAVQCSWSMRALNARRDGTELWSADASPDQREAMLRANLDTCHVWAGDGEHMAAIRAGRPVEVMLTLQQRLEERGLPPDAWPVRPPATGTDPA